MKKFFLILVLMMSAGECYTQNIVKGYVNLDDKIGGTIEITLSRLLAGERSEEGVAIARESIKKDGLFAFNDSIFTDKDKIYMISLEILPSGEKVRDTSNNAFKTFILSNKDSVRFIFENSRLTEYFATNEADKEWQKLKDYEARLIAEENFEAENYLSQTRNYTTDSLQILLVKLLSIKTLDDKKLLEKDIKENADFYLDLLHKLQSSDLEPASYAYLENKIRITHQDIIQRKYRISLAMNLFGFSGIVGLLFIVFRTRKKSGNPPATHLSRQEEKIKNLILQGKTNKEISAELFISISTVKTHTSNIYSKLSVTNRKDLLLKHQSHTGTST